MQSNGEICIPEFLSEQFLLGGWKEHFEKPLGAVTMRNEASEGTV